MGDTYKGIYHDRRKKNENYIEHNGQPLLLFHPDHPHLGLVAISSFLRRALNWAMVIKNRIANSTYAMAEV